MIKIKSNKLSFLFLAILFLFVFSLVVFYQGKIIKNEDQTISSTPAISSEIKNPSKKSLAAAGRQEYSITQKHRSPNFYKAVIDPEDVKLGQKQTMTVYLKDEKAPIVEVSAEIQTDNQTLKYPLFLVSGDNYDGVWESSWIVHDTHDTIYTTRFVAKNSKGEIGEVKLSWTDPGCGCTGINCTVSTSCTVSGVDGADGGTLTISTGGAITVPSGSTLIAAALAINGGSLSVNSTGIINIAQGNTICMVDNDGDNYSPSTTQIANCSSGRRRYLMASIVNLDCYDSNANVFPGQTACFSRHRGDGSFDYDCNGSITGCNNCTNFPNGDWGWCRRSCNYLQITRTQPSGVSCGQSGFVTAGGNNCTTVSQNYCTWNYVSSGWWKKVGNCTKTCR